MTGLKHHSNEVRLVTYQQALAATTDLLYLLSVWRTSLPVSARDDSFGSQIVTSRPPMPVGSWGTAR